MSLRTLDRLGAVLAVGFAVASIVIGDADKAPLYGLLAYALWRLGMR